MDMTNQYFPQSHPHPGVTLFEKLNEMAMGPKEFATRTGKPEKTISAILNGKSAITPDMSIQFEQVTQIPAHFWLNSQKNYDEFMAREKYKKTIDASIEWAKQFPLNKMAGLGWIRISASMQEKAAELLRFFGFADHQAWEKYYFNQRLKVAFRISLAQTQEAYAISAWLRMGELQSEKLSIKPFSKKRLEELLPDVKSIMAQQPIDFFPRLQDICREAGVKVVYTVCLPKAPINGATRWINDTPLIQLSNRHKRNDIFWFTVFHELAHIILHGKKDIFLEAIEYQGKDFEKEKKADEFAANYLLSEKEEQEILKAVPLNALKVAVFAEKFHTHPACIIGRLQHKNLIPFSLGNELIEKIEINEHQE